MKHSQKLGFFFRAAAVLAVAAAVVLTVTIRPFAETSTGAAASSANVGSDSSPLSSGSSDTGSSSPASYAAESAASSGTVAASEAVSASGPTVRHTTTAAGPMLSSKKQKNLSRSLSGGGTISVTVPATAYPNANLNNLSLQVNERQAQQSEMELLKAAAKVKGRRIVGCRLFDISISGGNSPEPQDSVPVVFSGVQSAASGNQSVYYVDTQNNTVEDMNATADETSGSLTFTATHFSSYASVSTVPVSQTPTVTAAQITAGLGISNHFAVFANNYQLETDMEGSVAVNNLLKANGGNLGNSHDVYDNLLSKVSSFSLSISVSAGVFNSGKTYSVGIYTDAQGKNLASISQSNPVSVTIDSTGSGNVAVPLSTSGVYYAYLIDPSTNQPVTDGGSLSGITGGGMEASLDSTSYINQVSISINKELFRSDDRGYPLKTIFGGSYGYQFGYLNSATGKMVYQTTPADGTYGLYKGTSGLITSDIGGGTDHKVYFASSANPMIDISGTLSSLQTYSATLAKAGDCDDGSTMKVINVTPSSGTSLDGALAAYFNYSNNNYLDDPQYGIPLAANQCLVINVDCKNCGSSVSVPFCTIGGVARGTSWNPLASRVIWNFYNSSSSNGAYTGLVFENGGVQGTILVPSGSIKTNGGPLNGEAIAQSVESYSGEIHQIPFGYTTVNRAVSFCVPASLTVQKFWVNAPDGAKPDVTVTLYKNTDTPVATLILNSSNGWTGKFTNLDANASYSVRETAIDGYDASYDNSVPGTVKITNTYSTGYVLPAAGGMGTAIFTGIGGGILVLSGILLILFRKRRAADGSC